MTEEPTPQTRENDPPPQGPIAAKRIYDARHEGRRWTVFYSALAAGLVSWAFGALNDSDQLQRSRENCQLVQEDRRSLRDSLDDQADVILGNKARGVMPADFSVRPYSLLKEFKPLLVIQAQGQRARAAGYNARIENCDEVHPSSKFNPFD